MLLKYSSETSKCSFRVLLKLFFNIVMLMFTKFIKIKQTEISQFDPKHSADRMRFKSTIYTKAVPISLKPRHNQSVPICCGHEDNIGKAI